MPFSGLATSKKKLQQDRAEVKAIVRGLERIRRYIAANRAGSGSIRQAVFESERQGSAPVSGADGEILSRHRQDDGRSGGGFHRDDVEEHQAKSRQHQAQ